ncbi:peptidylprolyl isomerase [Microbulbifer sp. OS29]|uniref:Peptidylprolyl isomerase n=1 Tax=Microbulbifer okhotskensis TaxID=2926617 RepID=A0A9X2J6P4_9GAMM|nr:peptidylprolyl isomerase [Microbulbifer okhotskensis]MCO1335624.1 peptidylprolyl isomerase [Microbulbifer okhotskensis]
MDATSSKVKALKFLASEPLLYFFAIGLGLFALSAIPGDAPEEIVIGEGRIEHLRSVFERRWQRPASSIEMEQLIENFLREEVLYREALTLGLDRNDSLIRRRLRMKMELAAGNYADTLDPGDETLQKFMQHNVDIYRIPARVTFQQHFFYADLLAPEPRNYSDVLKRLNNRQNTTRIGDNTVLPGVITETSEKRIDLQFGQGFTTQLTGLPPKQWAGPIHSAYGDHLILIEERLPARMPSLAEIRDQVLTDWQALAQKKLLQQQYEQYRQRYHVLIYREANQPTQVATQ